MKKIFLLIITIAFVSCKTDAPKDYVTFSGKITNHLGNDGSIRGKDYRKEIKINKDGTFSDTLHLKGTDASYIFSDGNEMTQVFLKKGYDVNITLDTKEFDETVKYTGNGAESNNFLAQKSLLQEKLFSSELFDLDKNAFAERVKEVKTELSNFINNAKNVDKSLIAKEKEELASLEEGINAQYKQAQARKAMFADIVGKPSPQFTNYENSKGGKTSLSDLKGKYVYVDVWATWCGPCKAEIPHLKEIEKAYHGKNIEFVSISVDNGRGYKGSLEDSKVGWKKMIAEKEMGGIQLFADKDWKSDFVTGYKINGIPRFILIDPNGNVVDADAPRPSSEKLKSVLSSLKL